MFRLLKENQKEKSIKSILLYNKNEDEEEENKNNQKRKKDNQARVKEQLLQLNMN